MDIQTQIHELETRLLSQEIRSDAAALTALLADDFVEFGASGNVWKKAQVIADLADEAFVLRTLSDFKVVRLAGDVVLATYLCSNPSEEGMVCSLRSSVWRRDVDGWRMVFHQGMRAADSGF